MSTQPKGRYLGLYYGSIDPRRGLALLVAWLAWPFTRRTAAEAQLSTAVRAEIGLAEIFAYTSARGALAAALQGSGLGEGDEVLMSGFTCLAVPTAVIAVGASPVYADIDPTTLNTPAGALIAAIGEKTRAVIVQHTMGSVAESGPVIEAAKARGILVIADCALSTGTRIGGGSIGMGADMALYSMELSKTISTGWGGVLAVRDPEQAQNVRRHYAALPTQGVFSATRDAWQMILTSLLLSRAVFAVGRYAYALLFKLGLFRLSTPDGEMKGEVSEHFMARMAVPQLRLAAHQWLRLPQIRTLTSDHARALWDAMKKNGLTPVGVAADSVEPVSPRACFLVENPDATAEWFGARNVEIGRWFDGPLTPPPASDAFAFDPNDVPNAVGVAHKIVNLPSHCGLDQEDRERLVGLIADYAAAHPADRTGPTPASLKSSHAESVD